MRSVDVVVVSYNSSRQLRGCVEPLVAQPGITVTVVDNASQDGSEDAISDLAVAFVGLPRNHGFAYACNVGWRGGRAPYVLFLNPDARITPNAIERLVEVAERKPRAAAVAPRIVDADGTLDYSMRRFPRLRSTYAQAFFLHRLFPSAHWTDELVRDDALYERPATPEWASGACLLVRREALALVGGLDEGFFLYCEDLDLCRRLREAGFELRYEPGAAVVHEGGASAPRSDLQPVLAASRVRYARLHHGRLVAALERAGIALGELTHSLVCRGGKPARRGHLRALREALR
jgi:GT2 family glycosyltransferase